jgi:hypothetical protein
MTLAEQQGQAIRKSASLRGGGLQSGTRVPESMGPRPLPALGR